MTIADLPRAAGGALLVGLLALASPLRSEAQRPVELSPNAPKDQPVPSADLCQWRAVQRAIAPYVARARATYPGAKQRYLTGLPPRHTFFVTTILHDSLGHNEQVFVVVDAIAGSEIRGRIWSDISVAQGYRLGQPYTLPERDLLDWLIAKPDGSEEGNAVGKFLDTYRPPATCTDTNGEEGAESS